MTYARWADLLINYESHLPDGGGGVGGWGCFHAWSGEWPEEGKKKQLLEDQSELQPHWTGPSWPPRGKWMGQRPVSDEESQEVTHHQGGGRGRVPELFPTWCQAWTGASPSSWEAGVGGGAWLTPILAPSPACSAAFPLPTFPLSP